MSSSSRSSLPRRPFLTGAAAGLVGLGTGVFRPGLSRAADRPILTHGLQS
jgi:alkaline phosphatase D